MTDRLDNLPTEIICNIISFIQDPRDVNNMLQTDESIGSILRHHLQTLKWNDDVPRYTPVDATLVLQLKGLTRLEMPIRVSDKADFTRLYDNSLDTFSIIKVSN
jgi:hypothetical protein